jgi:hypothetical protein
MPLMIQSFICVHFSRFVHKCVRFLAYSRGYSLKCAQCVHATMCTLLFFLHECVHKNKKLESANYYVHIVHSVHKSPYTPA